MLVGERSPAPRVVAGLRKLHPELSPAPFRPLPDADHRIAGVLRQFDGGSDWVCVRAAVRSGCLLVWREGAPLAARLPLSHLHLRPAHIPHAFRLSRLRDDVTVATFQTCNATEYARWVRALCLEILGQTPLPQVRFLDVLPAADTGERVPLTRDPALCAPRAPPRARRRLLSTETQLPRRDPSPAATDEGIVVEDDDYDSSSDRSDLSLSLDALRPDRDTIDAPVACDTCSKLSAGPPQHHTLPRAERARPRYLKRWEGAAGGAESGRIAMEAARRKTASPESRARSCSPAAAVAAATYVPVRQRRALFESLSGGLGGARSSETLSSPAVPLPPPATPRRASSLHSLQAPPAARSVRDLRRYFEAVARGAGCTLPLRHSAPPLPAPRAFTSLTCA